MRKVNLLLLIFILFFGACNHPESESNSQNYVRIRATQDPENLNPVNYKGTLSAEIINLLYQSLLTIDPLKKQIKPLLAQALPQVLKQESQSVFEYTLNPEARWPNQSAVTNEDVALSLKLYRAPLIQNQRIADRYYFIRDIIIDPENKYKFKVVCDKYTTEMDLMTGDFAIMPAYIVDPKGLLKNFSFKTLTQKHDSLAEIPEIKEFAAWYNSERFTRDKAFLKGSGGYEIENWKTSESILLTKKENWWGDKENISNPHLHANPVKIIYQIISDNGAAIERLRAKQLDVFPGLPVINYRQLAGDKSFTQQYALYAPEAYDFTYLGINGRLAKFADYQTRQALAYLIDVDLIIKATQSGFARRTVGPVIPSDQRFYNSKLKPYSYDLAKATALLQSAGWQKHENGWRKRINGEWVPLTITLNVKAGATELQNIALIFQQAAAKLDIPIKVEPMEGALLTNNLQTHNFEMFIRYLSGSYFVYNYKPFLHTENASEGGANYTAFGTRESDQLIDSINAAPDLEQKAVYVKQLQEILHEQSNLIFLFFINERLAINKRFTNTKVSGVKPGYDVSAFKLKD
jgi:peptide/nickel transport system substrate-binding protein